MAEVVGLHELYHKANCLEPDCGWNADQDSVVGQAIGEKIKRLAMRHTDDTGHIVSLNAFKWREVRPTEAKEASHEANHSHYVKIQCVVCGLKVCEECAATSLVCLDCDDNRDSWEPTEAKE
jgi:hypothetical protein